MAIDQTVEGGANAPARKSGLGKTLLLVAAALLLVGTSVGATLFLAGSMGTPAAAAKSDDKAASKTPAVSAPIYVELGEPFVVNFIEQGNQIRYLQVRIEAMTRDPSIVPEVARHLPRIRNNLVFMFSGFDYASLGTVIGKQKLRDEALAEVQSILKQETGKPGVEAIYFTSFVMQ
jgi:flagellar FliL protein